MGKSQPTYTKEFKQQAVTLFETSGKSKTQIARDLGISDSALSKWCKEFRVRGNEAFPGKGHQTTIEEEMKRLKRENEILRQERDILKKAMSIFAQPPPVKFQFIHEHRQLFPILRMCQVLDVSENGYYNWRKRGKSQRKRDDEQLTEHIEDAYYQNRGLYGSPRIHVELQEQGIHCGRKRVARLMQEHELSARKKKRKPRTTDSNHAFPMAPNLLEQDFTADAP
ncbi:transposase [Ktedonobacteria bacterium brp13]|nr:transposase [Ktedonobacteria bacterium brp13]